MITKALLGHINIRGWIHHNVAKADAERLLDGILDSVARRKTMDQLASRGMTDQQNGLKIGKNRLTAYIINEIFEYCEGTDP